jgi:hypothetical protein
VLNKKVAITFKGVAHDGTCKLHSDVTVVNADDTPVRVLLHTACYVILHLGFVAQQKKRGKKRTGARHHTLRTCTCGVALP